MSQKKRRIAQAKDAIVAPEHVHIAQQTMFKSGPHETMKKVHSVEPVLAHYIMAAAKDLTANIMFDCEMPKPVAMQLCERVTALALSVYGAYNIAVYEHYKDLFKGTPMAELDSESQPPSVPPVPPSEGEEGGTRGIK